MANLIYKYDGKLNYVKNIYYIDKEDRESEYHTGLVLELADGRVFLSQSTDVLKQFEEVKDEPNE